MCFTTYVGLPTVELSVIMTVDRAQVGAVEGACLIYRVGNGLVSCGTFL